MTPEFYLKLLDLIQNLAIDIIATNPGVNSAAIDNELQELYDLVNSYNPDSTDTPT